jgi:hypothetical protein
MDSAYRSELKEVNAHNFALFDAKLEQRIAEVNARVDTRFAELRTELQGLHSTLLRWMFLFFIGTGLTIIGFR